MAYEIELEAGGLELEINVWRGLVTLTGLLLVVAAVLRELGRPADQRTWNGELFGWIPYDLRVPSFGRLVKSVWHPDNRNVLVPTAFGVGWSVNLAGLLGRTRGQIGVSGA